MNHGGTTRIILTLNQEGSKKKSKHFGHPKRSLPPPHSLSEFYLLKNGHVGVTLEKFSRAREKGYFVLSCLQVKGMLKIEEIPVRH